MKICFPVRDASSLESEVYGHFGSAPAFLIWDSETKAISAVTNEDVHHAHGMCSPFKALGGRDIDCVIVGGIGRGALMKLDQAGIRVYRAGASTVRENIGLFASGKLPGFLPSHVCSGHSHGETCSHG